MDTMHFGRHNQESHQPVDPSGESDIAVVEQAGGVEKYLKDDDRNGIQSQKGHGGHLDSHGQKDFYGMEADAGCDIEIEIGMVNAMETPESGDEVKHGMLKIDDEIEANHTDHDSRPVRE
jgi:hypothetical protein